MRKVGTLLFLVIFGLCCVTSLAQNEPPPNRDPEKARLITSDIANFWRAFDLAANAATREEKIAIYQREYFDKGSVGLKDFTRLRIGSAQQLVETIEAMPGYYASIRPSMLRIAAQESQVKAAIRKLKDIYPDAQFPDVYVLIGRTNSAGTASENGLLIGGEMFGRNPSMPDQELTNFLRRVLRPVEQLPPLVTHELIHFQQKNRNTENTLLHGAIIEGGADFVAKLACGENPDLVLEPFGNAHERQLWTEFSREMQGSDISNWFYQGDRAKDRPADLGYYVGYRICEAFYQRAKDKKAAVREILETKDVTSLLKTSGYAERFSARTDRDIAREADAYLARLAREGRFSGAALIARNGKPIFQKAYGEASIESGVPNRIDTRYKIFSVTKQFTATAILLLAQEGKLATEDPVGKYLPDWPDAWKAVTIRHLLTHASGIPDFTDTWGNAWDKSNLATYAVVLPKIRERALAADPGTKYSYSNTGYELLGCIVEKVSGKTLPAFWKERIFQPLGMNATGVELPAPIPHPTYNGPSPVRGLASGYNGAPGYPEQAFSRMYGIMAAGGIYSTLPDLLKYDQALYTDALLKKPYRDEAFTPVKSDYDKYGYGWFIRKQFGRRYIMHDGGNNGFVSTFDRYPDDGVTILFFSNFGFAPFEALQHDLGAIVFGEVYTFPEEKK